MNPLPRISVVVPSFNQAKYLELTLRSILDQNYPDLELIVIDGGSKDESPEIIRKYEQHLKFWCSEPDGGQTQGIIKGFSHATGEVLCFLNSDDLFEPGALHEVGQYFSRHPNVDAVYGDAYGSTPKGMRCAARGRYLSTDSSGSTPTITFPACRCSGAGPFMTGPVD